MQIKDFSIGDVLKRRDESVRLVSTRTDTIPFFLPVQWNENRYAVSHVDVIMGNWEDECELIRYHEENDGK